MNSKLEKIILFWLGVGFAITAVIGAFYHLGLCYFIPIFASGIGLMKQRSVWEKMIALVRKK
jgi:hypothetical protein